VLGVDLSSEMIELARRLAAAEGLSNVRFEQADAQIQPFDRQAFDIAISRTGAMFFGQPVAAFSNIAGTLRGGGRLTLLVWQALPRNEWILEIATALAAGRDRPAPPPDAPGPFSMADPERVRAILSRAGFGELQVEPVTGAFYVGGDSQDAFANVLGFAGWMLEGLDDRGRARALENLRATLARHESTSGVLYDSAAWLITARKP
jgi:SAM-dependent methyltransferase